MNPCEPAPKAVSDQQKSGAMSINRPALSYSSQLSVQLGLYPPDPVHPRRRQAAVSTDVRKTGPS